MKRILGFLTIAILATITTAHIIEFSPNALANLDLTMAHTDTTATMINHAIKLQFLLERHGQTDEARFRAIYHLNNRGQLVPDRSAPNNVFYHGVTFLEAATHFSMITYIKIKVSGERDQPQTLRFQVYFIERRRPALILEIPVFQLPSSIPGVTSHRQLKSWAALNRVGLDAPFDSSDLLKVQNDAYLQMNFKWLANLLSYSVSRPNHNPAVADLPGPNYEWYVTRPLLLERDLLESLLNAMESTNLPIFESVGSTDDRGRDQPS